MPFTFRRALKAAVDSDTFTVKSGISSQSLKTIDRIWHRCDNALSVSPAPQYMFSVLHDGVWCGLLYAVCTALTKYSAIIIIITLLLFFNIGKF